VSSGETTWRDIPEVGTALGLRLGLLVCRVFGRRLTRAFVSVLALYFTLLSRNARDSSRAYLRRMGLPHGFWQVYAHLRYFAWTVADRVFLVQDRFDDFELTHEGHEHLQALLAEGRGALLLGAHIGSFEVMRAQSGTRDIPINVVGDFGNAERINAVLERVNPKLNTRLISMNGGPVKLAFQVKEAIDRGELVALLGDRASARDGVEVEFLGGRARVSAGPYLLASVLKCPIYLTVALHHAPNRYELHCEPFALEVDLPRGKRDEAIRAYAQRYMDRLEHFCRLAPNNWFNFFPYWIEDEADEADDR